MKCPNCGAEVQDGKFCKYCGASLPDPTKRVEVKIDKKVENVAEIKRAEYEAAESKLRQKKMKQDMRKGKVKWIIIGILALICVINMLANGPAVITLALIIGIPVYIVVSWFVKL